MTSDIERIVIQDSVLSCQIAYNTLSYFYI